MADQVPPTEPTQLGTVDVHHAPIVFFDTVGTFGAYNGIFALTLTLNLARPGGSKGVINQSAVAAYLRSNREGMLALRDFIDKTLLMDTPAAGEIQ